MIQIPSIRTRKSNDWVLQFINIIFLILLFFLVNGTIVEAPQQDVIPPVTLRSDIANPPRQGLYVDQTGRLFFQNLPISKEEFVAAALSSQFTPSETLLIVVDRRLSAVAMIDLVTFLKLSGLSNLSLVTVRAQQ